MNLPVPEPSGAQPPIELLRLWLDQGVFYDGRDNAKLTLLDMQIITAMGMTGMHFNAKKPNHGVARLPNVLTCDVLTFFIGGGCNPISPRFMRHFNVISVNKSSDETMKSIFSKIIMWHLDTRYIFN